MSQARPPLSFQLSFLNGRTYLEEMEAARADQQNSELRKQKAKLQKLGRVLRDLLAAAPNRTKTTLEAHVISDLEAFLQRSADDAHLKPLWDDWEGLYRCPQCMWELDWGICPSGCGLEFDIDPQDEADYTSNEAFNPDRVSQPRGGTPLRDAEQYFVPSLYHTPGGFAEYEQLRQRGATRLMCETFNLEFHADIGIVAWADGDIYEEFAGPLMQKGDFWKIMLGRRIKLDEDDPDGSLFMEALLEDALVFPLFSTCEWETVEESPGIWVTRATGITPTDASDDSNTSSESDDARADAWGLELGLHDQALEPGYVAPSLAVDSHHYETSEAESEDESDVDMIVDDSMTENGDDGWAWEANVPDTCWAQETLLQPEGGANVDVNVDSDVEIVDESSGDEGSGDEGSGDEGSGDEGLDEEFSDDDSADSDFDSDEVLSGDEVVLAVSRR